MAQPYEVREINLANRRVTIEIRADMLGTLANHCKTCPEGRRSAQSTRRFGYALAAAGDVLFGKQVSHPDLENAGIVTV
jgi:hypothetical protein